MTIPDTQEKDLRMSELSEAIEFAKSDALRDSASIVAFQAHQIDERIAASLSDQAATLMRDKCVSVVRELRDKFQQAADASSLPNDLTASRDAAAANALNRALRELESLTLDTEQEKQ